jgi:hypothetical protein
MFRIRLFNRYFAFAIDAQERYLNGRPTGLVIETLVIRTWKVGHSAVKGRAIGMPIVPPGKPIRL